MLQCIMAGTAGERPEAFATIRASLEYRTPEKKTGNPEGAVLFPRIRGAPGGQAERLCGARGAVGSRHRAGLDDEARREICAAPGRGIAAPLPANPAEHDPRSFPANEGALDMDHAPV